MKYDKKQILEKTVWVIEIKNSFENCDLLLSKVSEAVNPLTQGNEVGEGGTMDNFLTKQKNMRFIINGGFNHYRKNFYEWSHNHFNIGDPVGLVKIRNHYYEDLLEPNSYGFFTQKKKGETCRV